VILLAVAALYRPLAVEAFDPAFLRAVGGQRGYRAAFSVLVVLALVTNFQAFGTLLAVGPMLLPAAAARCWSVGAAASIALAIAFCLASSVCGLLISYHGNLPSGPTIALSAGMLFGLSLLSAGAWRRLSPLLGSRS
jgi:zinc/manganese transport system permease protein